MAQKYIALNVNNIDCFYSKSLTTTEQVSSDNTFVIETARNLLPMVETLLKQCNEMWKTLPQRGNYLALYC